MNTDLLRTVARIIESVPAQYEQATYARSSPLGPVHCVAGWALLASGAYQTCEELGFSTLDGAWLPKGSIPTAAAELLDITDATADILFDVGWLPRDAHPADTRAERAAKVANALRALANGAAIHEVTADAD